MTTKSRKTIFNLKLTREQRADLKAAAALETERRRDDVSESALFREIAMRGVHELLRQHGRVPKSAPAEPLAVAS